MEAVSCTEAELVLPPLFCATYSSSTGMVWSWQFYSVFLTVPLTLNLTHACVCMRAWTRLTRVKVNNLACIVSAAREFGVHTNARGTLDMHDTNMPATCTRFAI